MKFNILVLFLLLNCNLTFSQGDLNSPFSRINYGIKIGLQPTNLYTNLDLDTKWRTSYVLGIFGNYPLTKKFTANAELLYSDKGEQLNNEKLTFHRTYLNFPLTIQYNIHPKLSLHVGGELGFLLSSYAKQKGPKIDFRDFYGNPFDFGIVSGIGFQPNPTLGFAFRYTYGLTNILSKDAMINIKSGAFESDINARTLGYRSHNQTFQLTLSYRLHKSKPDTLNKYKAIRVGFGIKAGLNMNNTYCRNLPNYNLDTKTSSLLGVNLGMFLQVRINKDLSFIPELQLIRKGYNYKSIGLFGYPSSHGHLSLYYVEFPLVLSHAVSKIINLEGGPVFGRLLMVKDFNIDSSFDRTYYYKKPNEFGLTGGVRFKIPGRISIACRYYRGLTNISEIYQNKYTTEYNHNVQFSMYLKLNRGKFL